HVLHRTGLAFRMRPGQSGNYVGRWIVIGTSVIIAPHLPMKRIGSILLIGFFFLAFSVFGAQRDDPSEIFLKAYMTAQQGEKFEHENQFKTALARYRSAGSLIEELRKSHADWQPAIVDYRGRKISEGILRIQDKMSTQNDLTSGGSRASGAAGSRSTRPGSGVIKNAPIVPRQYDKRARTIACGSRPPERRGRCR